MSYNVQVIVPNTIGGERVYLCVCVCGVAEGVRWSVVLRLEELFPVLGAEEKRQQGLIKGSSLSHAILHGLGLEDHANDTSSGSVKQSTAINAKEQPTVQLSKYECHHIKKNTQKIRLGT